MNENNIHILMLRFLHFAICHSRFGKQGEVVAVYDLTARDTRANYTKCMKLYLITARIITSFDDVENKKYFYDKCS